MNFGDIAFSNNTGSVTNQNLNQNGTENPNVVETDKMNTVNVQSESTTNAQNTNTEKQEEVAIDFGNVTKKSNYEKDADNFSNIDFGPLQKYLDDDNVTDISYSNGGQLWLKTLDKGVYRADQQDVNNALMEKIAFQCSNIMGKTFNMAHPFLDSESAELRMNFVHDSIARNGIAAVFRKTPAKIRLEKNKLLNERYLTLSIHDFLINCVKGHCNIIVCGETGSGKTELVKYLASHTAFNEKLITIEDTLELHLDRIYPTRDIVAMKTNNIASYSDVLVTCMRQNPKWILLSEVRSAEAVTAVRNSISSGHNILSTIHADKAESIPHRMYSLLESNIDVDQFLKTIYRYVQIGIFVRGRYSPQEKRFVREIAGVTEFYVTDDNKAEFNNIYLKTVSGEETYNEPTKYLKEYLEGQGIDINNLFGENKSSFKDFGIETGKAIPTRDNSAGMSMGMGAEISDSNTNAANINAPITSQNANVQSNVQPVNAQPSVQPNNVQPNVQPANAQPSVQPNNVQPANVQPSVNIQPNVQPNNVQSNVQPVNIGQTPVVNIPQVVQTQNAMNIPNNLTNTNTGQSVEQL